jgi:hypothetical protein
MADTRMQIGLWVREIHGLMTQMDQRWTMARTALEADEMDEAIVILREYFQMKEAREHLEVELATALRELEQDREVA